VNGPPLSVGPAQEQERNRSSDCSGTYPELLSTAADGPVMGRGFSISAGQQIV
jgi:hypothetical protein